jgi:hypothetical protein
MEEKRFTLLSYGWLVVVTMCMVGVALLPAADRASAAGISFSPAAALPDDGDHYIFLPLIMRRWPPVPYAPELNAIENPLWSDTITLTWEAGKTIDAYPVTYYELEESNNIAFTTTQVFTAPADSLTYLAQQSYGTMGPFYYRIRANNVWGMSNWSNVASTLLLSPVDHFNYSQTGWATRRTSYWDLDTMRVSYNDGELITQVEDRFDFAIFSPMRPAPEPPYVIKMRTKIIHKANETSFGIVFGGNGGTFCGIDRYTANDPNGCFSHYYRLNIIWGGYLKASMARIDYHEDVAAGGDGMGKDWGYKWLLPQEVRYPNDWNNWEVRVYANGASVHVNDKDLFWIPDTTYIQDPYYGIFSSTYEYNGARFRHEYYIVEPLVGEDADPANLDPMFTLDIE